MVPDRDIKKASNTLQLPGFQSRQLIGSPQHLLPSTADWLVETKKENFQADWLIELPRHLLSFTFTEECCSMKDW